MSQAARIAKLQIVSLALFLGAVFATVSRLRLVDGDEGFYLLAAKLVFQGRALYRDFFYTQMPLLPLVYGGWMRIAGETWDSARLLSCVFAAALGCLLCWHVTRITGSRIAGCLAALLFVSSTPVVVWFTVVKSYSLSTLLLFGAYLAVSDGASRWAVALSGLLLALSVDTRLYLAGIAPVFLLGIYFRRRVFPGLPAAYACFCGGLALGLAPNLYWIVHSPESYYFNNLGYHAVRSGAGLVGAYSQKIETVLRVSGLLESAEANGLPFGLLILVNGICALTYRRLPGPRVWFAMCIAAAIVVLSALPTPAYEQYFCVAVPFLIVGALSFAWNIARSRAGRLALLVVLLANLSFLGFDLRRYTSTGTGLIGLLPPTTAADWRLQSVRDISRELDRQTQPGDAVLSLWPGYLFESHAVCIPGMETHVGLSIAGKLTAAQLTRYRILSAADIEAGLKLHKPCLAVVGNQESMLVGGAPFERMLHLHGYRVSHRLGHTSIYTCN